MIKFPNRIYDIGRHGGRTTSTLIKTVVKNITPPEVTIPLMDCQEAVNHRMFDTYAPGSMYIDKEPDLRYAVIVNGEVYNDDHSMNLVGRGFVLDGKTFNIPTSSEGSVVLYVDDTEDGLPCTVWFRPSPNTVHNIVYGVSEYQGPFTYTDKDSDFFICIKPNIATEELSCVGSTSVLTLGYGDPNPNSDVLVPTPTSLWYTIRIDDYYDFNHNFISESSRVFGELNGDTIVGELDDYNNLQIYIVSGNGETVEYKVSISSYVDSINAITPIVITNTNPTALYDANTGEIKACIVSTVIDQSSSEGATSSFEYSTLQLSPSGGFDVDHEDVVYSIQVNDGEIYGPFDMSGYDTIILEGVTLDTELRSQSVGSVSASSLDGSDVPTKYKFIPASNMSDANIWGVDMSSNPTLSYDSVTREVTVYMTADPQR